MSTWTDVSGASSTWTPLGSIVLEIMAYEVLAQQDSITPRARIGDISKSEVFNVAESKTTKWAHQIDEHEHFKISESKTVTR